MPNLKGKKILIGVSAGIAAYKIANLVRLLVKKQAEVKVVMSEKAKDFVSPLTLSVLSKNKVFYSFSSDNQWNSHVELALWADLMIIAPATANTMAKMANGICDNFLLSVYFSAKCSVMFAPAMDLDMYEHFTTQRNIQILQSFGNQLIPSEYGELASGLFGKGRMAEPETIFSFVKDFFSENKPFSGKKILITAGATYEPIDPVRFIGNHSSGKMGISLANAASEMGAEVVLVLGNHQKQHINSGVKVVHSLTAEQMYLSVNQYFDESQVAILCAAVSDYTPVKKSTQKIKKSEEIFSIELTKTKDILEHLGKVKRHQKLIGFALETENELGNAKQKIIRKNLDAIVLNSLNDKGAGFATDTNKVTFITSEMTTYALPLKPKKELAYDILGMIINYCL